METIPDLWPDDIKVEVLAPAAILRSQEGFLARRTQGLLQAKLSVVETDRVVQLELTLIAPALDFYSERVLTATHDLDMPYPVVVTADAFDPPSLDSWDLASQSLRRTIDPSLTRRRAATDEEFIALVREVFQSADVRALIHSLIARINEACGQFQGDAPQDAQGK